MKKIFSRLNLPPILKAAQQQGKRLQKVISSQGKRGSDRVVMVVAFDGHGNLADMIRHHAERNVGHIAILDTVRDDSLFDIISGTGNASLWRFTEGSITTHDVFNACNYLRGHLATGKWCLSLDATDYLRYAYDDAADIVELTAFLETEQRLAFHAIVVHMYPDNSDGFIRQAKVDQSDMPKLRDIFHFCDGSGSAVKLMVTSQGKKFFVAYGPDRRLRCATSPQLATNMLRIPLVRWGERDAYELGTEYMRKNSRNNPVYDYHATPTGCLQRYDPDFLRQMQAFGPLMHSGTISVFNWRDLSKAGFISTGQWF